MYIGAHVSAAGGVHNALIHAEAIGATAFALFTKSQRQWEAPPLEPDHIERFKSGLQAAEIPPHAVLPHDSYLINLGNPDFSKRERALRAFIDEVHRVDQLGLTLLNFHPGSHLKLISEEECIALIADSINTTHAQTQRVITVLENTAGQGSNIGYDLGHLASIIAQVKDRSRVGVCIDTCHAFAAGYDLSSEDGYHAFFNTLNDTVGLEFLKAFHLNDAMKPLGSRVDRHAPIGKGYIGEEAFKRLMRDERFRELPFILETPEPELWPQEIAMLREWAK